MAKCFIDEMITAVSLARKQQARAILIKIQDFREVFYLIELPHGWLAPILVMVALITGWKLLKKCLLAERMDGL